MIEVLPGNEQQELVGTIVLRPNQSFSWQATKFFLGLLLCISLLIGSFFLAQGYWLILPFSVLEVSFVGACFYYLLRRAQWRQVIQMTPEQVHLSAGRSAPEQSYTWQRFFTKVTVTDQRHAWYPPRIHLQHRDEHVELGAFLNTQEKDELVGHLRRLIRLADQRQIIRP